MWGSGAQQQACRMSSPRHGVFSSRSTYEPGLLNSPTAGAQAGPGSAGPGMLAWGWGWHWGSPRGRFAVSSRGWHLAQPGGWHRPLPEALPPKCSCHDPGARRAGRCGHSRPLRCGVCHPRCPPAYLAPSPEASGSEAAGSSPLREPRASAGRWGVQRVTACSQTVECWRPHDTWGKGPRGHPASPCGQAPGGGSPMATCPQWSFCILP